MVETASDKSLYSVTEEDENVKDTPLLENTEPNRPKIKVGYSVGITEEGKFRFNIDGTEVGLVELMGLHAYAQKQIDLLYHEKNGSGDFLVGQVGNLVMQLNRKLDSLLTEDTAQVPQSNQLNQEK